MAGAYSFEVVEPCASLCNPMRFHLSPFFVLRLSLSLTPSSLYTPSIAIYTSI